MQASIPHKDAELHSCSEQRERDAATKQLSQLRAQVRWIEETIVEIIISEGQNEVSDFQK